MGNLNDAGCILMKALHVAWALWVLESLSEWSSWLLRRLMSILHCGKSIGSEPAGGFSVAEKSGRCGPESKVLAAFLGLFWALKRWFGVQTRPGSFAADCEWSKRIIFRLRSVRKCVKASNNTLRPSPPAICYEAGCWLKRSSCAQICANVSLARQSNVKPLSK